MSTEQSNETNEKQHFYGGSGHHIQGGFKAKLKKFMNKKDPKYLWYRAKWNWSPRVARFGLIPKFPTHVDIEPSDACNLRCVMCPQSFDRSGIQDGFITMDLFHKIVDECAKEGLYSMKLNWRGEPLIHPKFIEMVKYAKDKGIKELQTNSNGTLLNENKIRGLIEAGLDGIIFSMDGATKETYEKIRVRAKYDILMKNIKDFVRIRNEMGKKKPFIRIQMVRMKDNVHEVDQFIKMWEGIVDHVATNDYSNRGEGEENDRSIEYDQITLGRKTCPQPFQRLMVAWDGKVMMCCGDWFRKNVVGDVTKQTLKEIWNGAILNQLRELHKQSKLDVMPACRTCNLHEGYRYAKPSEIKVNI